MAPVHANARKNLTKSEFKLFEQSFPKELKKISPLRAKKAQKSLTAQPKMHVERKDSPREKFLHQGKLQEYQKQTQGIREENTPGKLADKRILGYSESNSRKGQIARDRRNAAPEKEK